MQDTDIYGGEILHVFTVDGHGEAERLAADPDALSQALGGAKVAPGRAEVVTPGTLGEIGLAGYLHEGEGASLDAVRPDAGMLNALTDPVIVLLPRAVTGHFTANPPLSHVGSYPLEGAKPAGAPIRTPSAEGTTTPLPDDPEDRRRANRRAQGMVAMVALVVMLTVALVVWAVAI